MTSLMIQRFVYHLIFFSTQCFWLIKVMEMGDAAFICFFNPLNLKI